MENAGGNGVSYLIKAKSNHVCFRKPRKTEFNFKIGYLTISVVDRYKYMGVILNDALL